MELKKQVLAKYKQWIYLQGDPELARKTFLFNLQADKQKEAAVEKIVQILLDEQYLVLSKKMPLGSRVLWVLKAGPELK